MALPLGCLRVLDFTHVLAGPYATRIMGDMGADVVKVGSMSRPGNAPGNAYYTMWNRNKRSLALDMSTQEARTVCRRAERDVARLAEVEKVGEYVGIYLNRLSDALFVMARFENKIAGESEPLWDSRA